MRARSPLRVFVVIAQVACIAGCKSGATSPSTSAVADFVTGVTASDGTRASAETGPPPAPNGGPVLTVTSSGTVSSGGNDLANLQSPSSFLTVYVSVAGATGYYQLQLQAPTTSITLTDALSSQLPSSSYQASYQAASPTGLVGAPATVTNTVQPAPTITSVAVTGTAALVAVGQVSQLVATETLSNNTTQDVTSSATWSTSNAAVASVSSAGRVTAVAAGSATITATTQGKSGTLVITVTTTTLQLTGVWNVGHTPTSKTGSCAGTTDDQLNVFKSDGQTTVSSSGSFSFVSGQALFTGTMSLSSGNWSFSGDGGGCGLTDTSGPISASGTCSSGTACSGTFSSTSTPSGGTESGTVAWTR